jgi:signal transduction histidine kinase
VLLNLLANSADAIGEDGEIRISTAGERDADGRPMIAVRVQDTGPGMSEQVQSRIFEPFFTTKEQGTGLGLCIAAQIMARNDGSLVLESSSPAGTTFAVWAPVAPVESDGKDPCG